MPVGEQGFQLDIPHKDQHGIHIRFADNGYVVSLTGATNYHSNKEFVAKDEHHLSLVLTQIAEAVSRSLFNHVLSKHEEGLAAE